MTCITARDQKGLSKTCQLPNFLVKEIKKVENHVGIKSTVIGAGMTIFKIKKFRL
jgi:hypothetical protein